MTESLRAKRASVAGTIFAAPFHAHAYENPTVAREHAIVDVEGFTVAAEVHGTAARLLAASASMYRTLAAVKAHYEALNKYPDRITEYRMVCEALRMAEPCQQSP